MRAPRPAAALNHSQSMPSPVHAGRNPPPSCCNCVAGALRFRPAGGKAAWPCRCECARCAHPGLYLRGQCAAVGLLPPGPCIWSRPHQPQCVLPRKVGLRRFRNVHVSGAAWCFSELLMALGTAHGMYAMELWCMWSRESLSVSERTGFACLPFVLFVASSMLHIARATCRCVCTIL